MALWGDWTDWGFWLAAGAMCALVAGLMILALVRGRRGGTPAAAYDLQVYRDQLREIEKDLARGTISEEEARRVRTEVSRRVLEADRALAAGDSPHAAPKAASWIAGGLIAALCAGSVWLYTDVGVPGMADEPMAGRLAEARKLATDRPSQASIEAEVAKRITPPQPDPNYADLVAKLRAAVAKRPDDLKGQELLARHEAGLGNYIAAYHAQQAVIRIKGKDASGDDYARLGELMIYATNGYVSPEAEDALNTALKLDPSNGSARFFSGLMMAQIGRPDIGFRIWEKLLSDSPPDAPWVKPLRAQIEQMARMGGIRYQLPPAPGGSAMPGPSAGDVAAAQNMTPAQRQEMIRGMVQGLAERLDTQGGSPAEWARLIGAYGVLGEADKRQAALDKARAAFKNDPQALAMIEAAAKSGAPMAGGAPAPALPAPTGNPPSQPPTGAMSVAPATPPAGLPGAAQSGAAMPGPSAADVQAAQQMTPEDRQKMIEGMVQRLNDKLASEGGTAPEWARLIGAYGVLGNTERATAIWTEAQTRFAQHPEELALIRAAAVKAGVAK